MWHNACQAYSRKNYLLITSVNRCRLLKNPCHVFKKNEPLDRGLLLFEPYLFVKESSLTALRLEQLAASQAEG